MLATSLLVAAALAAGDPATPTTAVLAVAEPPGPGPDLALLSRAVQDALADRRRAPLAPDEVRRRMAGRTGTASLSELDRAYLGAVAAQRAGDLEGAARTLRAVMTDLEHLPDGDESVAQTSRALLRLAYIESALAHRSESRDLVERLVRLDPSVRPDPELYPPGFVRQVDAARAELRALPRRLLTVTTGGRPARIFVDGRERGPAPLALSLPRGQYRVSAVAGSATVRAGVVDLADTDRTVAIDVTLAEAFRPDGGPGLALGDRDRAGTLVSAGATLGVANLLAVSAVSDKDVRHLSAAIYDVQRGRLQREGRIRLDGWAAPPGAIPALVDFLLGGVPSGLVIVGPELAARPDLKPAPEVLRGLPPPRRAEPRSTVGSPRALGWVAFSAGVLAIGAAGFATYEGFSASGKYSDAKAMVSGGSLKLGQDPARYNGLVRDGDSASNAARIGAGAAVGLALTSAALGYWSYRQTGEIGPLRF
jgi:hypothetical protein